MYYSIEIIEDRLKMWLDAEAAVATGQRYKIGTRDLQRADLSEIRKQIQFWEGKLNELTNRGGLRKTFRVVPRDI